MVELNVNKPKTMKLHIPFTDVTLHIGKKAVEVAKEPYLYGAWQNQLSNLFTGGGFCVNYDTLYTIYNNVVDVKMAIRRIQNAVLKGGYQIQNKADPEMLPNADQEARARAFLDNPERGIRYLKDFWVRDRKVAGNSFWLIRRNLNGDFLDIKPIDPRTMTVVADQYGNVVKYIQSIPGLNNQTFEPDEIIHSVSDWSTANPRYGVSPIESIVYEAKTEMAAQASNWFFYENNAVPSHLLVLEENLGSDQIKEIKEKMDERFKGTKNRWKSGIIPFVKDIKTVTPSQKEMQYLEGRAFSTKKVVVAFGVDSFILGYTEGVQRSNADVIYTEFYENTIRPEENEFEDLVNNRIFPAMGLSDIYFWVNNSHYNNEDTLSTRLRENFKAGLITINEAREQMGMDESDNALAGELMFNGVLLDDLGQATQQMVADIRAKMVARNNDIANLLA